MISVTHFRSRRSVLRAACAGRARRAGRPSRLRARHLARSTDDRRGWLLVTEWENVGSYRRALGNYEVKLHATPLLGEALDLPSAFERLPTSPPGGADDAARERSRVRRTATPGWFPTPSGVDVARWTALTVWAAAFGCDIAQDGIPYWRSDLLLWLVIGLARREHRQAQHLSRS